MDRHRLTWQRRTIRGHTGGRPIANPELLECVGRYRLLHLIGRGGDADVHLARRADRPGLFAMKRLRTDRNNDPVARGLFEDEVKLGAQLRHPSLITAVHAGRFGHRPWMVMQYVDGPSVGQLLQALRVQACVLPWRSAVGVGIGLADALNAAHSARDRFGADLSVIHRALSPGNVLVSVDGWVGVSDFGLARSHGQMPQTSGGRIRGNLLYMSPEQLRGERVDHRTDVFSFGLLLYQLIAQRHPFAARSAGDTARAILRGLHLPLLGARPDIPRALSDLVERCLEDTPDRRPRNAKEVRSSLRAILGPNGNAEGAVRRAVRGHFVWNDELQDGVRPWHTATARGQRRPQDTGPARPKRETADYYDPATAPTLPPVGRRTSMA